MDKFKKVFTKKSKNVESSSSRPTKKKRQLVQEESEEEEQVSPQHEEEMDVDEDDAGEKPEWKVGTSLHTLPLEWQFILYKDKMNEVESTKNQLICERKMVLSDFRGFGLVENFERMGWKQALLWNNKDDDEVYLDGITEWMGTLERDLGNNPPETTKLIGTVNHKKVTMSFATLDRICKFDSGCTLARPTDYLDDNVLTGAVKGNNWVDMIRELFVFSEDAINMNVKLERQYLKPLPLLIMSILTWNVCPRTSDKKMVRYNEVVVLYALITGSLALSLRQIIMLNIWDARNKRNKTVLPHPRLITVLIKAHKAIPRGASMVSMPQLSATLARLVNKGNEWTLETTPQAKILREVKGHGYLVAPQGNLSREEVIAGMENREAGGSGSAAVGSGEGPSRRDTGLLGASGRIERPPYYENWSPFEKQMWDLSATQTEYARVSAEEQRRFQRGMVYAHELEVRRRFEYDETVRHRSDYLDGLAYVETPPQYDYQTMPPFSRGVDPVPYYPQSHDSDWLPRNSCVARMGESSSDAPPQPPPEDPFETRSMYMGLMESIFGTRRQ